MTLAGFLLFQGIIIIILGGADGTLTVSSLIPNQAVIFNLVQGVIDPTASWMVLGVLVVIAGGSASESRGTRAAAAWSPPPLRSS